MTARPASPGFARSAAKIFGLSLGQTLWSRRSIFLGLLVAAPILLALLVRVLAAVAPHSSLRVNGAAIGGPVIFGTMMWFLYIRFVVPVLGVFYGTSLIADEVDDKTITYLFSRPIPRGSILVGKYLAYLVCTLLLVLPSILLVFFLITPLGGAPIGPSFPLLVADLGIVALGLASYGALFALAGARLKRPLVAGLVFVMGWEPGVLLFPGYLKRLTVAYYLQGLVPHAMPADSSMLALLQIVRDMPTALASLVGLALIVIVSLWAGARTVETREYVLEQ